MGRALWTVAPGTHRHVPPQSLLAMSPEKRKLATQKGQPTEPLPEEQAKEKLHTLETFSYEFFRCSPCSPTHTTSPVPVSPSELPESFGEATEAGMVSTWGEGDLMSLPQPPWRLEGVTCVSAECCGYRWHLHRDPHWSLGLQPDCQTGGRWGGDRGAAGIEMALTPASIFDRALEKETVSRAMYPLTRSRGHLWAHSPEPLRQPLLKRVHANTELWDVTCQIFIDILPQLACPSSMPSPWAWTLPCPQEGPGLTEHKAGALCSS